MKKLSRGEFIKKNLIGGAAIVSGAPFLSSFSSGVEELKIPEDYQDIKWSKIRKQFYLDKDLSYLNMAGLGLLPTPVHKKMVALTELFESRGSHGHLIALESTKTIAAFLNAEVDEIAVTRNATEGMNIIARSLDLKAGDEVILTTHEHVGGAAPWLALKNELGLVIKLVDLDLNGKDNYNRIAAVVTDKTKVISFSHITCTTGMILPAKDIAKLCKERGIYSCVDGAQAVGMIPIDLKDIDPDFYTASGHKWMLGPKGTGILFINKRTMPSCKPTFVGAYSDSKFSLNELILEYRQVAQREEYGTRNATQKIGLEYATEFLNNLGIENIAKRGRALSDHLRNQLKTMANVEIITPEGSEFSAAILSFKVKGVDCMKFVREINDERQFKLRAIYENDLNAIRVSCGINTNEKELDALVERLKK